MNYREVVKAVASELGLPQKTVDRTYKAYWKYIREHIISLPLKEDMPEEEFLALQTGINLTRLGKLYVPLWKYQYINQYYKEIKDKIKKKSYVTYQKD